ncbi:MAG: hypothetical protein ACFHWX_06070 [Bacteroidota bacterium]
MADFEKWFEMNDISFERKLADETAFDGVVKIYELKTNNPRTNELLAGQYFGDFRFLTENGVLLRKFNSKTSWPKTQIVHLNLDRHQLMGLKQTDSSWNVWTAEKISDKRYAVSISPEEKVDLFIR